MGELYVRAVKRFPDRVALIDSEEEISYREMGERMSQFASVLYDCGLEPGSAIAQLSSNRVDAVCMLAAASMIGLRYTPLHPLGSESDQKYILEDAEIDCLIIDEHVFEERGRSLAQSLQGKVSVLTFGKSAFADSVKTLANKLAPVPLRSEGCADDVGLIMYTGGTTGKPKGVMHTHRSLIATFLINMAELEWPAVPRFLAVTPVSHAALGFIPPVLLRGGVFIMQQKFTPASFLETVSTRQVSATFLVPTMIYVLLEHDGIATADLGTLETVIYGASPMSPARMLEALEVIGRKFTQIFGQTECPNMVSALFKHDHDCSRPDILASCGQPLIGNEVCLMDEEGKEVEQGEVGELCVRGPLVMHGYWKLPEETARALRGGWLHTGDMARLDEQGYLYIVDRVKDLIISGGFNVFPREIEDVINAHNAVSISCVIGVPDSKWGEAVLALVVLKEGEELGTAELIELVRDKKGPAYAPKSVRFVDSIPLTGLGKPDKKAVRRRFWKGNDRQVG